MGVQCLYISSGVTSDVGRAEIHVYSCIMYIACESRIDSVVTRTIVVRGDNYNNFVTTIKYVFRHCNNSTDWPISQWTRLYCPVQWHTLSRHAPPLSQSLDVEQTLSSLIHLSRTATNGDNSCILPTSTYHQRLMTHGPYVQFAKQLLLGDHILVLYRKNNSRP